MSSEYLILTTFRSHRNHKEPFSITLSLDLCYFLNCNRAAVSCPVALLWEFCFLGQADAEAEAVGKAAFFVISAEATDGIDDPILFPECLAVHSLVEVLKVLLDLVVIYAVVLVISVVEHLQDAAGIIP